MIHWFSRAARPILRRSSWLRHLCCWGALLPVVAWADFDLRDGDTVVFLGDSITAARQYSKIIENYTLLRFPERKVRFFNVGQGGETAKKSLARLDQDVFARGATVLTVAYGINDIGWGTKADAVHKQEYLDALAEIIERCAQHKVRVYICSAAITAEEPDRAEKSFLQQMCDEGLALAKAKGAGVIDVQRTMREVQRRALNSGGKEKAKDAEKTKPLHVSDGIHLNDLGQLAMGFAILKGLGAPADVSSATVQAGDGAVTAASGCRISQVQTGEGKLEFTRLDDGLPLNLHPFWALQQAYVPIGSEINRFSLSVPALPSGKYTITADGRALGHWSARELERGVNLASATTNGWEPGGTWDAQAHLLKVLTDMRDEAGTIRRGVTQTLPVHPDREALQHELQALEEKIVALQRAVAKPVPVRFVIQKTE